MVELRLKGGEYLTKMNYVSPIQTIYVIQAIRMIKHRDEGYLCFISSSEEKIKLSIEKPLLFVKTLMFFLGIYLFCLEESG